jgi:hypothetical protein
MCELSNRKVNYFLPMNILGKYSRPDITSAPQTAAETAIEIFLNLIYLIISIITMYSINF